MLPNYANMFHLVFLAVVQGITELLPISSTAHLVIANNILNTAYTDNFFLTTMHLGTTIAIVVANAKFLFDAPFSKGKLSLYAKILIGSIPAAIVGIFFDDYIESSLRGIGVIATTLITVGIAMILIENFVKNGKTKKMEDITFKQAALAGVGQALALIPGVSRSGATTLIGVLSGIEKYGAIRFAFLLGLPALFGSFLIEFVKTDNAMSIVLQPSVLLAIGISGLVGYLAILLLEKVAKSKFLTWFGVYRIVLGIILIVTMIM